MDKIKSLIVNSSFKHYLPSFSKSIELILNESSNKERDKYNKIFNLCKDELDKNCFEDEEYVFDPAIFCLTNYDYANHVKRNLDSVSRNNYNLIFSKEIIENIESIIGVSKYNELVLENINKVCFSDVGLHIYKKYQSIGVAVERNLEKMEELNPMLPYLDVKLEYDFYNTIIENLSSKKSFKFFEDKLNKIVDKIHKEKGEVLNVDYNDVDKEFASIVRVINLLEYNGVYFDFKDEIESLNFNDALSILNQMAFCIENSIEIDPDMEIEFENLESVLKTKIKEFTSNYFQVDQDSIDIEVINDDVFRALSIYGNHLKGNKTMEGRFKEMLNYGLSSKYKEWKMWSSTEVESREDMEENLEKMKQQKLIPQNITLEQYVLWEKDFDYNIEEIFESSILQLNEGINKIMQSAVEFNHIPEELLDSGVYNKELEKLLEPIKKLSKRKKDIQKRFKEQKEKGISGTIEDKMEYNAIRNKIDELVNKKREVINKIKAQQYIDGIRNLSYKNLEEGKVIVGSKKVDIGFIINFIIDNLGTDYPNFVNDINQLQLLYQEYKQNIFGGKSVSKKKLNVTDKVNFETYLYIGEKPVPSCQNFDGTELNYGLLSYISDPNVKIVQMYDENGGIIARSVLRLLSNEKGDPKMFMERAYSVNNHPKIEESLYKLVQKKASEMNVDLYTEFSVNDSGNKSNDKILYSYASKSGYVYTDSGGGKKHNGEYSIYV